MAGPFLAAPLILTTKSRKKSKQLFSVETMPNLVPSTSRQAQHMPAGQIVGRSWFVCGREFDVFERTVAFWRENVLFLFEKWYLVGG